jgi:hypothetical protein
MMQQVTRLKKKEFQLRLQQQHPVQTLHQPPLLPPLQLSALLLLPAPMAALATAQLTARKRGFLQLLQSPPCLHHCCHLRDRCVYDSPQVQLVELYMLEFFVYCVHCSWLTTQAATLNSWAQALNALCAVQVQLHELQFSTMLLCKWCSYIHIALCLTLLSTCTVLLRSFVDKMKF